MRAALSKKVVRTFAKHRFFGGGGWGARPD